MHVIRMHAFTCTYIQVFPGRNMECTNRDSYIKPNTKTRQTKRKGQQRAITEKIKRVCKSHSLARRTRTKFRARVSETHIKYSIQRAFMQL